MDALNPSSPSTMLASAIDPKRDRQREGEAGFSLGYKPGDAERAPAPRPPLPAADRQDHPSALAEACSACSGPATPEARAALAALAEQAPSILAAARVEHDRRGAPIQAFPALACAAIQGDDPEGWVAPLEEIGASFDAKTARAQASFDLLEMPGPRGGSIASLNARVESLSIWTLACAQALHPDAALRALSKARADLPGAIAPLESELPHFSDPPSLDKPGLGAQARADAFLRAARELPRFAGEILPSWIASGRGGDAAAMAPEVAGMLDSSERSALMAALEGQESEPASAYRAALEAEGLASGRHEADAGSERPIGAPGLARGQEA